MSARPMANDCTEPAQQTERQATETTWPKRRRWRRIRLHHRRRGLGRLRAGQPSVGRSQKPRAAARGRRPRQLDLVPHPGRLPVRDRQSALRLDVQDRSGAGPQRPRAELSARQGDRRLVVDQRHDLHARPGRRLRPLASARPQRLGLGRRAADLQAARASFPRRERASRAPAANGGSSIRACAGICSTRSARRRSRPASSASTISTPATTRARRPTTSTRSSAGAGRRRAAFSSPCSTAPTCGSKPAAWSSASSSTASARSACASGRTARSRSRAAAAR